MVCEKNDLQAQIRKPKGESRVRIQVIGNTSDHIRSITTDRVLLIMNKEKFVSEDKNNHKKPSTRIDWKGSSSTRLTTTRISCII